MAAARIIAARVFYNDKPAGVLSKTVDTYSFKYDEDYINGALNRPVSITMPLRIEPYESEFLFPVFVNMLSEGANKRIQSQMLKIDESDYFRLLLATAKEDSIGPITIKQIDERS